MAQRRLVAVECRLGPGMFSTERVFKICLANGEDYYGVAPSHYCWNAQGGLVAEGEPAEEAGGKLAARIVEADDVPEDQVALAIPDGEVVAVRGHQVGPRPTEIRPHVPVGP
jgi:hypothetical protein